MRLLLLCLAVLVLFLQADLSCAQVHLSTAIKSGGVTNCPDCLPGLEVLGMGWDAVYGQTRAQAVVEYTFKSDKKYKNPFSNQLYVVPDQITAITATAQDSQAQSSVAYSAAEQAKSMTAGVDLGLDIKWGTGAFSASTAVTTASRYLSQRASYSSYVQSTMAASIYQASLSLPNQLNYTQSFAQAIESLLAENNTAAYQRFIGVYGTHYLQSAFFGGRGVMSIAVNAQLAQTHSKSQVEAQAGVQFQFLKAGAKGEQAQSWFLGNGQHTSAIHTQLIGGDPSIVTNLTMWNEWYKSFFMFPAAIFAPPHFPYTVEPLYNLIADPGVKRNMMLAVQSYINSHPYPQDPSCKEQVYCPVTSTCCPTFTPVCCPAFSSGCARTQEECDGYFIRVQENKNLICAGHECNSNKRTRNLGCTLGYGWSFEVQCSVSGTCMFYSNHGHSCSFAVGTSCTLPYMGCKVTASAS